MKSRELRSIFAFLGLLFGEGCAVEPELLVQENGTPQGTVTERYRYYLRGGVQVKHGSFAGYHLDGTRFNQGNYEHGKLHGIYTLYYRGLQKKHSEIAYRNGKQHGFERWWSPEGELLTDCEYRDGKPWAGRTSSNRSISIGNIETNELAPTYLFKEGVRDPGSVKTIKVSYPSQSPSDLPEMSSFLRWHFYSYRINSNYRFLDRLPPYDQVPFLIDWCAEQNEQSDVAYSQLVALTRVNFGQMRAVDPVERQAEIEAWKSWWQLTGKDREAFVKKHGIRDESAWKNVARGRNLPLPKTPIALPPNYSIEFRFRSGDYGGVITETITIERKESDASFVRVLSTKTGGEKTTQCWQPFTITDADRFARSLGYLIDHPWLMNDEHEINRRYWKEQSENGGSSESMMPFTNDKIQGRESFHLYYPNAKFVLKTRDDLVWWNDDPWHWHGDAGESRFLWAAQPLLSTLYPFIASMYPESQQVTELNPNGWKSIRD